MKQLTILILLLFVFSACSINKKSVNNVESKFITTQNGQFIRNGKPYYYIGANYWYGAILGSKGSFGNRKRLLEELDIMKASGIDNLRILAGAEGPDGEPHRVTPTLQLSPGKYNNDLLEGLDFLLSEMAKRKMVAILYINNSWEWSGGYAQYLNWNGYGDIPYPMVNGHTWPEFMNFSSQFHHCKPCKEQFYDHVRFLLSRKNQITGIPYITDTAIMAWEIGNEPRAFSNENKPLLLQFIDETSTLIKSVDPNHLVTTGTEGSWGCEGDINLFKSIHQLANIDYLTMHIWPYNWRWLDITNISGTISSCLEKAGLYMDEHIKVADELKKPIVFEEFGLPRDNFSFDPSSTTIARDKYYEFSFSKVFENAKKGGTLAGANFWTFSGTGRPNLLNSDHFWKPGEDIIGDPPQEEQGLNSVFDADNTMKVVSDYNNKISALFR
jgi:mannan endo-1,4-beta-mannosidase